MNKALTFDWISDEKKVSPLWNDKAVPKGENLLLVCVLLDIFLIAHKPLTE